MQNLFAYKLGVKSAEILFVDTEIVMQGSNLQHVKLSSSFPWCLILIQKKKYL